MVGRGFLQVSRLPDASVDSLAQTLRLVCGTIQNTQHTAETTKVQLKKTSGVLLVPLLLLTSKCQFQPILRQTVHYISIKMRLRALVKSITTGSSASILVLSLAIVLIILFCLTTQTLISYQNNQVEQNYHYYEEKLLASDLQVKKVISRKGSTFCIGNV